MTSIQSLPGTFDCRGDSLNVIDRALSADRYGSIRAIIVRPNIAKAAYAVIDRCWHDAAIIIEDAA